MKKKNLSILSLVVAALMMAGTAVAGPVVGGSKGSGNSDSSNPNAGSTWFGTVSYDDGSRFYTFNTSVLLCTQLLDADIAAKALHGVSVRIKEHCRTV